MSRKHLKSKGKPMALAALKRAAKRAVEIARQTNTPAWVLEGDKLVDAAKKKTSTRPARKKGRA